MQSTKRKEIAMIHTLIPVLIALAAAGHPVPVPVECTAIDNVGNPPLSYCETGYGIHYDEPGIEDGVILSNGWVLCPDDWTLSYDYDPANDRIWSACM